MMDNFFNNHGYDSPGNFTVRHIESTANRAESKAHATDLNLSRIERKVDHLALNCQAMWELLRDYTDFTEADIENKVLEIDNRDGNVDGKINLQKTTCEACGRPTNTRRRNCVMCGAERQKNHRFEA